MSYTLFCDSNAVQECFDSETKEKYKILSCSLEQRKIVITHCSSVGHREVYKLLTLKHIEKFTNRKIDKISHNEYYILSLV
jgi:hypothetical protein